MDAKQARMEEKLAELLRQAATVASQLQALEQGPGTPHYDQIELPAHEAGQRLSQMIQSARAGDVAAEERSQVACPDCGRSCLVQAQSREIHSMDGGVSLSETVAYCRPCRRSFFPSA